MQDEIANQSDTKILYCILQYWYKCFTKKVEFPMPNDSNQGIFI